MNSNETECPYCHCPVEATELKRYVNGIMPIFLADGCEYCQPLPVEEIAFYDSDD